MLFVTIDILSQCGLIIWSFRLNIAGRFCSAMWKRQRKKSYMRRKINLSKQGTSRYIQNFFTLTSPVLKYVVCDVGLIQEKNEEHR